MTRKHIYRGLLLILFIVDAAAAQEATNSQKVQRVQYNGGGDTLFFIGESKWSAPGCPNATYVQIKGSEVPGINGIMSIGLSAKMAQRNVSFWGSCDTDTDYFNAFYIVLE